VASQGRNRAEGKSESKEEVFVSGNAIAMRILYKILGEPSVLQSTLQWAVVALAETVGYSSGTYYPFTNPLQYLFILYTTYLTLFYYTYYTIY
jgi:hypothetical protein